MKRTPVDSNTGLEACAAQGSVVADMSVHLDGEPHDAGSYLPESLILQPGKGFGL